MMSESFSFLESFRILNVSLRRGVFLGLALMASACSVNKLEDVMGPGTTAPQNAAQITSKSVLPATPSPSLTHPPTDALDIRPGKAVSEIGSKTAGDSDPGTPVVPEDVAASPLLAAEDDQTKFSSAYPWRAILSVDGIDATNAEGTICSGRYGNNTHQLSVGLKILLACSDGETAVLQVLSLQPDAVHGNLKIGNIIFGVVIDKYALPIAARKG